MSSIIVQKPASPLVTGLSIQSGVKTTTLQWDASATANIQYEVWSSPTNVVTAGTLVSVQAGNNFAITGLTGMRYFFVRTVNQFGGVGTFAGPVVYTPGTITSADTVATSPGSISSGVGASSSAGNVSGYGTWSSAGHAQFDAAENAVVSVSIATSVDIGTPSGTGLSVYHRSRLYDVTLGQDVPAGTKVQLLWANLISPRGQSSQYVNTNETWISGFRGLIVGGHTYRLYVEVMKQRQFGTATVDVSIGSSVTSTSAASI